MEKKLSFDLDEVREKVARAVEKAGGYFETEASGEGWFQIEAAFPASSGRVSMRAEQLREGPRRGPIELPVTVLKLEPVNIPREAFADFVRRLELSFLRGGG